MHMVHALLFAAAAALAPSQIATVISNAEKAFHDYVFPDVAAQTVAMLQRNVQRYEALSDPHAFVAAVNTDLRAATHDKHVHVFYPFEPQQFASNNSPAAEAARHQGEVLSNFGFDGVRRLPGNVGYLAFSYFSQDVGVAQAIQAAMAFLANTDALIIDLRHNGGGSPTAAETLEAYFFTHQQPITSIVWRDPKTGKITERQQYTAATVPGPLYVNKPIYLLTSGHTFSCAEQFTYDLHNLKRVRIIGETTGGGANPGEFHDIGLQFAIFIPDGRAYSPITKTNWESTGIAPDVSVPAAQALERGYVTTLHAVQAHETNKDVLDEVKQALADPSKALTP